MTRKPSSPGTRGRGTGKPRAGRSRRGPHRTAHAQPSPVSRRRPRLTPRPGGAQIAGHQSRDAARAAAAFPPRQVITSNSLKLTARGTMNRANSTGFSRPHPSSGLFLGTGVPVQGLDRAVTHPATGGIWGPARRVRTGKRSRGSYEAPGPGPPAGLLLSLAQARTPAPRPENARHVRRRPRTHGYLHVACLCADCVPCAARGGFCRHPARA